MRVSIIVAVDENWAIGFREALPWGRDVPADLARFQRLTMGHHLLVGHKTFQSIGKPLSGRIMLVLTRSPRLDCERYCMMPTLETALAYAQSRKETELFCIGGANVYQQVLPLAQKLYLTMVHSKFSADTFFPSNVINTEWVKEGCLTCEADSKNKYAYTFFEYSRREK